MYREKFGPFNQSLRADAAIARAITAMRGGKPGDYMPWPKEPEPVATLDDVFGVMKIAAASNRRKK
jgi:hypothetical protein